MLEDELENLARINYAKGLARFMGNKEMYNDFLYKFLYDSSFEEFFAGVSVGDFSMADKALQTLKGTSSNLSLEQLCFVTKVMVQALAENKPVEELSALADKVGEVYSDTCDAVREYL